MAVRFEQHCFLSVATTQQHPSHLPSCCPPAHSAGDESGEEEEDGERLDQQMGEAGPEGEDVDERLWNDEDRQEEQQGQVGCGVHECGPVTPSISSAWSSCSLSFS